MLHSSIGLIFYLIYSLCLSKGYTVVDYLLAIIGIKSIGNPEWFIFAILFCYLLCSIVYVFRWKNNIVPTIIVVVFVVLYEFVMFLIKQPSYKWETVICFAYGFLACVFRGKINNILSKKTLTPFLIMLASVLLVVFFQWLGNSRYSVFFPEIAILWFPNLFFCLFFVAFTRVFVIKSPVLEYFGKASFAIFLMHMIIVNTFKDFGTINNEWLNYLVLFSSSLMVGIPIFYLYKLVDKYITNPIVEWNRKIVKNDSKR